MSRLLKSLSKAHQERKGEAGENDQDGQGSTRAPIREPGYFWISALMLVLIGVLILGGFLILRNALLGAPP